MDTTDRNDELLRANVEAFTAALEAGRDRAVVPEWPASCLGVLDGSNQDATTIAALAALAPRHARGTLLTAGSDAAEAAIEPALAELAARGIEAEGVLAGGEEAYTRILAVLEKRAVDLLALPCPHGHDLGELGATTLGTVVEVCLARAAVPVLVVRGAPRDAAATLASPHLWLDHADTTAARAVRLALGTLARDTLEPGGKPAGRLRVTFVLDELPEDEAAASTPEELMPLLPRGLSSVLHRLEVLAENAPGLELVARVVAAAGASDQLERQRDQLHIVPMPREAHGVSELVHELVLSTLDPVLVVAGSG